MLVWLNTGRQSGQVANRVWHLASSSIIFTIPAHPLFVFAFSLCLSLHILTLSSSGAVAGSGEEMTGNRTMEGSCQLPAIAWSLLPQLQHFRLYHQHTDWWGQHKLVYSYILLYKHGNGNNREKERETTILCMSLKQTPKGNSHVYTVAAILRKTCIAFISP